jgi:hypothetical protein
LPLAFALAVLLSVSLPVLAQEVPVVVDGDALKFGKQRMRLYGIDAPELHQTCDGGTWAAGKLVRDALVPPDRDLEAGGPKTIALPFHFNGIVAREERLCLVGRVEQTFLTFSTRTGREAATSPTGGDHSQGLRVGQC